MAGQRMRSFEMTEIVHWGLQECLSEAFTIATDECDGVFLSVDIDVCDPGHAPGTGTPEPGGLSARELLDSVRRICLELPVVGIDVVEVSLPYDHADITAALANRVVLEALSAIARKRRDERDGTRWDPAQPLLWAGCRSRRSRSAAHPMATATTTAPGCRTTTATPGRPRRRPRGIPPHHRDRGEALMAISQKDLIASVPTGLLIGGSWRDSSDGGTLKVEDPATGEVLTEVADATVADGGAALDAAVAAQHDWAKVPPRDRGEILRAAFERITERADEFAMLMTLEMGKTSGGVPRRGDLRRRVLPLVSARRCAYGRYSVAPNGDAPHDDEGAGRPDADDHPRGTSRWRWAPARSARRSPPAADGGQFASQTPLSMLALAQLLQECACPTACSTSSRRATPATSWSRSSATRGCASSPSPAPRRWGASWWSSRREQLLRVSMELGGNAPFIVFEDADLDRAVDGAMLAKMRNIGEACTAANRFYVHESVSEEFGRRFAERMGALRVGKGTEDGVDVGPLIDAKARDGVAEMVEDAQPRVPRSC